MLTWATCTAIIVAVLGSILGIKRLITWKEYATCLVVSSLVVLPLVGGVGTSWARDSALRYQEFYNGVEVSADEEVRQCMPGRAGGSASSGRSNCQHEYRTGQWYTYQTSYTTTSCDSDGTNCTSTTYYQTHTAYIYYPYANYEYAYRITDSLGGNYRFPGFYVQAGDGYLGGDIPDTVPLGPPSEWLEARERLDAGDPRAVTGLYSYDNYILASDRDKLIASSDDIESYLAEGLLPDHTENITRNPLYGYNQSWADKVSFVGVDVDDEAAWQESLMGLNAALGSELQGDLHLVLVDSTLIDDPTSYAEALKAYWLSDVFGRRTIAKNAIIVVAGVYNDRIIQWAQASTGMPIGNLAMLRAIQDDMERVRLDPALVIGNPRTVVSANGDAQVTLASLPGVLERIVLRDHPFERVCMTCQDDGESGGYGDLEVVGPAFWQWAVMAIVAILLSAVCWQLVLHFELARFVRVPNVKLSRKQPEDKPVEDEPVVDGLIEDEFITDESVDAR